MSDKNNKDKNTRGKQKLPEDPSKKTVAVEMDVDLYNKIDDILRPYYRSLSISHTVRLALEDRIREIAREGERLSKQAAIDNADAHSRANVETIDRFKADELVGMQSKDSAD